MEKIDAAIFKAYDIRGIYPKALDEDLSYRIGRVFAQLIKKENPGKKVSILVSRDMRLSSDSLHEQILQSLADEEVEIIDVGLASTPMFYFAVTIFNAHAGIQISASHNPKDYNGFKMTRQRAMPINGDNGIYEMRDTVLKTSFTKLNKPVSTKKVDVLADYIAKALEFVKSPDANLTLVADSANAMAGNDLDAFFRNFSGIKLQFLNRELNGSFPAHEANPLKEETLTELKKKVVENKANFGIATDGDGDRYMFIDENGQFVRPDLINALLARKTVKEGKGEPVLFDLRSSRAVAEEIEKYGGKAAKCRVGHSFIKSQMRELDAYFAGELSGHYYLEVLPGAYFEFPLFVVAMLMEIIQEEKTSLSKLIEPIKHYFHTNEFNFKMDDKEKALKTFEEKYREAKLLKLDGLSVEYPTWWFNVRASNTEPLLRFNLEANTKEEMEQRKKEVTDIVLSLGGKPE